MTSTLPVRPMVITLGDPAGIGPEIIAKAFRDAPELLHGCFVAGDVALQKALGVRSAKHPAKEAQAASQAWRPWRSYAVIRAWAAGPAAALQTNQNAI